MNVKGINIIGQWKGEWMDSYLSELVKLYELLNKRISVEETLRYAYQMFKGYIPYDRIGIVLLGNEGKFYSQAVCSNYDNKLRKGYCVNTYDTSLNNIILTKEYRVINDYKKYLVENPNSEATQLIVEEGIQSSIACPLITNDICFGILIFSSKQLNAYQHKHLDLAKMVANAVAITIEKNLLVDDLILTSITGFARLVEAKDSDTGLHLERMQNYTKTIAIQLQSSKKYKQVIDESFIENAYRYAPLHDIGKVGIADGILLKPAKLTQEEFEVMKRHTIIGAEVLKKASNNLLRNGKHFFDMAVEIALYHHEKYNGTGYPFGLREDEIPISAKIVMVADVFDALTSKRVYKTALAIEDALNIIMAEKGKSFDPDIVDALMDAKEEMLMIYEKYQENIDLERR